MMRESLKQVIEYSGLTMNALSKRTGINENKLLKIVASKEEDMTVNEATSILKALCLPSYMIKILL